MVGLITFSESSSDASCANGILVSPRVELAGLKEYCRFSTNHTEIRGIMEGVDQQLGSNIRELS
jgi:hypothetical protein